jgi:hypothetical protein
MEVYMEVFSKTRTNIRKRSDIESSDCRSYIPALHGGVLRTVWISAGAFALLPLVQPVVCSGRGQGRGLPGPRHHDCAEHAFDSASDGLSQKARREAPPRVLAIER